MICHGIPDPYQILKEGDIINVDVTSIKDGYYGDASRMYYVGSESNFSNEVKDLVQTCKKALDVGIKAVAPGKSYSEIGVAIQDFIISSGKPYGIVREYTGHGVGRKFHEAPQIVHYDNNSRGGVMKPGMTFTIEPMINQGTHETVLSKIDGWTVRTADGKLSAQWEHTILVTENGYEILTA